MSDLLAKWADFSKGEAGWVDKSQIPAGFWTGEQILAYRDGSIGPRSGLVDLAPTGLPGGTLYGLGYVHPGTSGVTDYLWIHKGTTLGRIPLYDNSGKVLTGQAFAATTGSFAATPVGTAPADFVEYSPAIGLFAIDNDQAYQVDWTAGANGTLTALTGSSAAAGAHIELFNEFLLLAGNPGNSNRVWYSAPGDFNTWPAANFFDISGGLSGSSAQRITNIRRLRDMLLVFTDTGQLFIVTNLTSDASTLQIRQYLQGDAMSGPQGKAIVRDRAGVIWFTRREELPFIGDQAYDAATAVPVSFDGATRAEILPMGGYLRQSGYASDRLSRTAGVQGRQERSVVLTDADHRALVLRGQAWSRHRFPGLDGQVLGVGLRGEMFVMNGAHSTIYAWQFELDRPPWKFSASAAEPLPTSPLDAGAPMSPLPWVGLPEFRPVNGESVSVERVEVFFTSHATRDTAHNTFDVFVQQYDRVDADEKVDVGTFVPPDSETSGTAMVAGGVTVGCANTFDEAAPASIDHRRRVAFYVQPDQLPAPAIRVMLRKLVGVSIHEVHVYGTLQKQQRP